ncbi:MAG: CopG family transcriptional regulator [Acidimicrobiia bacterium]
MERTQIYLSKEQRRQIARLAKDGGVSQAEVVRRILDRALGFDDGAADRIAAIDATAGLLHDAPDWPEWLEDVRGATAAERLTELGL